MPAIAPRLVLSLTIIAAACQGGTEVAIDQQAILGGSQPSPGQFPTVVGILLAQGAGCTGTLVAPDLVLTAAHCISPRSLGQPSQQAVTDGTVVFFDSTNLPVNGQTINAADTIPHPSFVQPGDPDVGLIRLANPKNDREPSPINFDPGAAPPGTAVDMVGYGVNDSGGAGPLFYLANKVTTSCSAGGFSDATFLCFNQQDGTGKCSGDSGGPSFLAGTDTVVGITSFGDRDCQVFGADMRTDASADFLMANAPELLCGVDAVCNEDCDADPDCSEGGDAGGLGNACGEGEPECEIGFCASGPGGMRCTRDCDPAASDCPAGFDCLETSGDSGACWPAEDGGCNASGSSAGGLGLLVLIALVAVRRRRQTN